MAHQPRILHLFTLPSMLWKMIVLPLFICLCVFPIYAHSQATFEDWLVAFQQDAVASGVSIATTESAIQKIQFLPNIIRLDHAQPEFVTPFLAYYQQRVNAKKVQDGKEKLLQYQVFLEGLENQYGVPKTYLIAFWGMETNYGKNQGNIDVLSSLATLAYEGRRAAFFRQQLIDAMHIIDQTNMPAAHWQGSWAGAFGHMQFMPSTFIKYAVDGDADTYIDIVQSERDALTSAANYLSTVGWQNAHPAMIEVQLPNGFLLQEANLYHKKTISEWAKLGVVALESLPQKASDTLNNRKALKPKKITKKRQHNTSRRTQSAITIHSELVAKTRALTEKVGDGSLEAAIILPQGWRGPAFMVLDNFNVLMDWNRSVNYALSVAQLAQRLDDQSPMVGGQDAESGALTFTQMQQLQMMLNQLGFDAGAPDGFPGLQTQSAIRGYQLSEHLPADGYASVGLFHRLNEKNILSLQ